MTLEESKEVLLAFIEIKIAGLYKKYCWDMITITDKRCLCGTDYRRW